MTIKAHLKEAEKVALFLEKLALKADTYPFLKIEGDNHQFATMLRRLARRIRNGEHRE